MQRPQHGYRAELALEIEARWQSYWNENGTFHTPNPVGPLKDVTFDPTREKMFVLDMFPYPSGAGIHVGHPLGYIATDVYARFQRLLRKNVLHAMGWDAFGLPAEQFALQTGRHPRDITEENIAVMRSQLRRLGLGHDERRSISTIDESYFKWTQWMFLKIWDSWYDEELDRARPITDLVAQFQNGLQAIPGGVKWNQLSKKEKAELLDSRRLAYLSEAPVNWCPGLGTVLANEEVTSAGRSERGNFLVFNRNLQQWKLRITAYAERLEHDLDFLDWPASVKSMQRNWIGRSEGALIDFELAKPEQAECHLAIFSTKPETILSASYLAVSPEHWILNQIPDKWPKTAPGLWVANWNTPEIAIRRFREGLEETEVARSGPSNLNDPHGVFTGMYSLHPITGAQIPIFAADYVLPHYGTGAIMGVPEFDEKDAVFANKYQIPSMFSPDEDYGQEKINSLVAALIALKVVGSESNQDDSPSFTDSRSLVLNFLAEKNKARRVVNYRLRDWLFSRQRYWGEPIPIVFDRDGIAHAVPDSELPVVLPESADYAPTLYDETDSESVPVPPLAKFDEWVNVLLDIGDGQQEYRRETNTMPNWAGSCWYELRYLDPNNDQHFVDPKIERYWMGPSGTSGTRIDHTGGVDLYIGGVEHAVLHLLYARFWHKVLYDLGYVSSSEPFKRLFNQGYIQAYVFRDSRGQVVPANEVTTRTESGANSYIWNGQLVSREFGKMGKSLKNVVTPDDIIDAYGADTFRIYEMSLGPLDDSKPWEPQSIVGSHRFLQRVWRNIVDDSTGLVRVIDDAPNDFMLELLNETIVGVRDDFEALRFNTAVSKLISLNNGLTRLSRPPRQLIEPLLIMLSPLAPHICEELWMRLGNEPSICQVAFPAPDETLLAERNVKCVVQIGGKVICIMGVAKTISTEDLVAKALSQDRVQAKLSGRQIIRTVAKPPRLVNFVVN